MNKWDKFFQFLSYIAFFAACLFIGASAMIAHIHHFDSIAFLALSVLIIEIGRRLEQ